ncbi:MAG TPA: 50S ribosomal protein L11 methyltransferase [Casimicrobiaceae bacterium]|nr:50S ribosomal protein L11 methyltransferase [Casimicrobiaceae bacterium]
MPEQPPARYIAVTFDVAAQSADAWGDALLGCGALSVDAADAGAGTAAEVPLYGDSEQGGWRVARLTVLFDEAGAWQAAFARAAAALDEPLPAHSTAVIQSADWVRETQAQFAPVPVTARLWIVPSWCAPPDPSAIVVTLDPGLAFGTGTHPTTLLCLRWLADHMPARASVLDYGCGSGILAIAAAKLGAAAVTGVDIDPQAVATSRANARANAVTAAFCAPDELAVETFDVAVANILASPLELLAPLLAGRIREGGQVVLSGILEAQAAGVLAAYERWFNIGPWGSSEGWVALAGVRSAR